jgi:hypothetical protein
VRSPWQVACGGSEVPFTFERNTYTYMWNRATREHAYYWHEGDLFVRCYRTREVA